MLVLTIMTVDYSSANNNSNKNYPTTNSPCDYFQHAQRKSRMVVHYFLSATTNINQLSMAGDINKTSVANYFFSASMAVNIYTSSLAIYYNSPTVAVNIHLYA